VREYLDELRARQIRKPTDWIVSPSGSRPAVPTALNAKKNKPSGQPPEAAAAVKDAGSAESSSHANGNGSAKPRNGFSAAATTTSTSSKSQPSPRKVAMSDESYENHAGNGNGHALAGAVGPVEVVAQDALAGLQQTMSQWLDLQKGQLWMTGRFLDMHENLIRASNGLELLAPAPSNSMSNNGAVIDAPPVVHHRSAPVGLAVPPAPVLPPLPISTSAPVASPAEKLRAVVSTPTGEPVPAPKETNGTPQPASATNGSAVAAQAKANLEGIHNGGAPPVEQFRKDLLDAVSQRTGYPIDMLDESAALEAELGIDSIKTVEIFSSLTTYHSFLPGGDENQEETLATFSRMKTLRDIISVYEQRRNGSANSNGSVHAESNGAKKTSSAANGEGSGPSSNGPPVERFTVEAVLAADDGGLSKKKTSPDTIYS
jgi:hypothetical protein